MTASTRKDYKMPHAAKATPSRDARSLLADDLSVLRLSCEEALDGRWDRSDDGFESMIAVIDQALSEAKKLHEDATNLATLFAAIKAVQRVIPHNLLATSNDARLEFCIDLLEAWNMHLAPVLDRIAAPATSARPSLAHALSLCVQALEERDAEAEGHAVKTARTALAAYGFPSR